MGKISINISSEENQFPVSTGFLQLNIDGASDYVFTVSNFTTETSPQYIDPEGDDFNSIKIKSIPSFGILSLSGVTLGIDDVVLDSDIASGNFKYTPDPVLSEGYTDGFFEFYVSDKGSQKYSKVFGNVFFNVASTENSPPSQVGDGEEEVDLGSTFVFTAESLTVNLDPPYLDPEGDLPSKLLILSTPSYGMLTLNGNEVFKEQEIDWQDIIDGNFKYTNNEFPSEGVEGFEFTISDTGSGQYN